MKRQEKELNSFYEDDDDDRENEVETNLEQGITFYYFLRHCQHTLGNFKAF